MTTIKIYAAGAISNTTFEGSTHWYEELIDILPHEYRLLRPMRGKEFIKSFVMDDQNIRTLDRTDRYLTHIEAESASDRMVMIRDAWDLQRCDAVFMNLLETPDKVSIGCMMELGLAYAYRKPVVLVASANDITGVSVHPMVNHTIVARATTLYDGAQFLMSLFCDDL